MNPRARCDGSLLIPRSGPRAARKRIGEDRVSMGLEMRLSSHDAARTKIAALRIT